MDGASKASNKPNQQGMSPERLDQVISTTKPRGWIALITVVIVVIGVVVWAIVARIPQQTTAIGVVSELAYSKVVTATATGSVNLAQSIGGSSVQAGQVMGTISSYDGSTSVNVIAPATGTLTAIGQDNGAGVAPGDQLGLIQIPPDPIKGIVVATFLPASDAMTFAPGQKTTATVTNLASGESVQAVATVESVSSTPATLAAMNSQAGSTSTVELWQKNAGGNAYRVMLTIVGGTNIPASQIPQAGQPVQIVNTFDQVHPIELLFGAK